MLALKYDIVCCFIRFNVLIFLFQQISVLFCRFLLQFVQKGLPVDQMYERQPQTLTLNSHVPQRGQSVVSQLSTWPADQLE